MRYGATTIFCNNVKYVINVVFPIDVRVKFLKKHCFSNVSSAKTKSVTPIFFLEMGFASVKRQLC